VVSELDTAEKHVTQNTQSWSPPYSLEERLKYTLIPPKLYMWRLIRKHLRKGERELHILPRIVPPGRIAIDVGANKGVYSHLLARLAAQVQAFEPNPKLFRVLTRTLPANVVAHRMALSDREGMAELIIPRSSHGYSNQTASLNPRKRNEGAGIVAVPQRRLDSFGFNNVGFIKIDVEGFEQAVLEGARDTIMRERPVIQVELEEQHTGRPIADSFAQLEGFAMDGFFLRDGKLRPLAAFDAEANRKAFRGPDYINNFIFRPKAWSGPSWD
jgi:FkbM family methyltransferase